MKSPVARNLFRHAHTISQPVREKKYGHCGAVLWLTGLSGSGKSTIANLAEQHLFKRGVHTYILDGDNVRLGLNRDLGFSPADRTENIRRIGEVAGLFADAGILVLTAFVSPYRKDRKRVRALFGKNEFFEIFIKADAATCQQRDPKGLYKKARQGQVRQFTGVSAPYEAPRRPDLVIDTTRCTAAEAAQQLVTFARCRKLVRGENLR
jgi:adenylylsulfate kinase